MIESAKSFLQKVLLCGVAGIILFWGIKYPSDLAGIWNWLWGIFDHGSDSVHKLTGH